MWMKGYVPSERMFVKLKVAHSATSLGFPLRNQTSYNDCSRTAAPYPSAVAARRKWGMEFLEKGTLPVSGLVHIPTLPMVVLFMCAKLNSWHCHCHLLICFLWGPVWFLRNPQIIFWYNKLRPVHTQHSQDSPHLTGGVQRGPGDPNLSSSSLLVPWEKYPLFSHSFRQGSHPEQI